MSVKDEAERAEMLDSLVDVQRRLREAEAALERVTAEREAFREEATIATNQLAHAYETIGREYVERLARLQEES